jgi:hypothetical protein
VAELIRARRRARSAPLGEVLDRYRETLAKLDGVRGNPRRWNRLVDEAQLYHLRLRESEEGRAGIEGLLADGEPEVRGWAAAHALLWAPEKARPVLEALQQDPAAHWERQHSAEMTLQVFDKGELRHDWEP